MLQKMIDELLDEITIAEETGNLEYANLVVRLYTEHFAETQQPEYDDELENKATG